MKLWLLDADVVIKFLEIDVFDKLAARHELYVASSVIGEVKHYYSRSGEKIPVDFREQFIDTGYVTESTANIEEIQNILKQLPSSKRLSIHVGEIESLAILVREEKFTLCTFDSAAIRTLPFLNISDRAISAEKLLGMSGLTVSTKHKLDVRLSEAYFRSNLNEGKEDFIYSIGKNNE